MKKTIAILGTMLTLTAFAGDKGNGGGVHLCPGNRVEMYDLYEGVTRFNFTLPRTNDPVEAHLDRALAKIHNYYPAYARAAQEQLLYVRSHLLPRRNIVLERIDDANILMVDEGCSYQQLANWDEVSGNIFIKSEYYDRLDSLNVAALLLHEALYKVARERSRETITSDKTRRLVADALAVPEVLRDAAASIGRVPLPAVSVTAEAAAPDIHFIPISSGMFKVRVHMGNAYYSANAERFGVKLITRYQGYAQAAAELERAQAALTTAMMQAPANRRQRDNYYVSVVEPLRARRERAQRAFYNIHGGRYDDGTERRWSPIVGPYRLSTTTAADLTVRLEIDGQVVAERTFQPVMNSENTTQYSVELSQNPWGLD